MAPKLRGVSVLPSCRPDFLGPLAAPSGTLLRRPWHPCLGRKPATPLLVRLWGSREAIGPPKRGVGSQASSYIVEFVECVPSL